MTSDGPDVPPRGLGRLTLPDPPDVLVGEYLTQTPRQDRSRRAREALIAAALSRFGETGYEATTVDCVSKLAGVAVGGFYLHFRSKRQVLLVLLDRLLKELASPPWAAPDAASVTPMDRVRNGFGAKWTYAGIYRAWREATLQDGVLAALHQQIEAWTAERLAILLTAAAKAPGARTDVDIGTFSRVMGALFWQQLELPAADRETVSQTIVQIIKYALFEDRAAESDAPETGGLIV